MNSNYNKPIIQPECRCPNEFPRNENLNSEYCIKNSLDPSKLTSSSKKNRLNDDTHPLEYINDGNLNTRWISCILTVNNPIVIELDLLNGVYLIQRIEIFFTSLPPTHLTVQKFISDNWITLQVFDTNCDTDSCVQIPK